MELRPARLEPFFSPRPWGVRSLAPFFPEMSNLAQPIGEAWMTGDECRFANGPFVGMKLRDAWPTMPGEWAGTRVDRKAAFPLLVKFIFAAEKLSVQVHPDDEYAGRHEAAAGGRGKTEMWYAVRADPGAEVLLGMKAGVTLDEFKSAIADGTAEHCLERVPLRAGEAVFVSAGSAHTIGPGFVLCEVQQQSDLTYRVYDYNRRDAQGRARELHIEKALDVMRFGRQTCGRLEPVRMEREGVRESYFVACRYFATERWDFATVARARSSPEHFDVAIVLEGSGSISWGSKSAAKYTPAQVWLIPAALGQYEFRATERTSILRTYVPGDMVELKHALAARGIAETALSTLLRW
ncbi:MAG TPA: type I phosphomannose isomerase catalytic subunit [Candidatus Acidoferrales bacterium]|nr:type I phosphomannose isomerase catalytic subunit [Candidatus Acidoferrales bacterium]